MAVAGYLTYTGWTGDRAAYCEAGGGCDIVQSSQWATFLGAPTAFWGLLVYAGLVYIAFRVRRPIAQWRRAWVLAFIGLGVSVYLTAISIFSSRQPAPTALDRSASSLSSRHCSSGSVPRTFHVSPGRRGFCRRRFPLLSSSPSSTRKRARGLREGLRIRTLRGLAVRLADSGALFYGASGVRTARSRRRCSRSEDRLPYVECSPGGPRGPAASSCIEAGVKTIRRGSFPMARA